MTTVLPFRLKVKGESQVAAWHARSVSYRIHGIARLDERTLVLQWSGTASVSEVKGTAASDREEPLPVRTVELPIRRVAGLALLGGWWRPRVELRAADLESVADVPGARHGAVTLRIARRDRPLARERVANLEMQIADAALEAADAPPPLPPAAEGDQR